MEHDYERKLSIGQQRLLNLYNKVDLCDLESMLAASAHLWETAGNKGMARRLIRMRNKISTIERQHSGEASLLAEWETSI